MSLSATSSHFQTICRAGAAAHSLSCLILFWNSSDSLYLISRHAITSELLIRPWSVAQVQRREEKHKFWLMWPDWCLFPPPEPQNRLISTSKQSVSFPCSSLKKQLFSPTVGQAEAASPSLGTNSQQKQVCSVNFSTFCLLHIVSFVPTCCQCCYTQKKQKTKHKARFVFTLSPCPTPSRLIPTCGTLTFPAHSSYLPGLLRQVGKSSRLDGKRLWALTTTTTTKSKYPTRWWQWKLRPLHILRQKHVFSPTGGVLTGFFVS